MDCSEVRTEVRLEFDEFGGGLCNKDADFKLDKLDGPGVFYMEVEEKEEKEEEEEEEIKQPIQPSLVKDEKVEGETEEVIEEEEENGVIYYCKVLFYLARVVILFAVVFTGLFNLTNTPDRDTTLWTALLSSCVGYALSDRKLKSKRRLQRRRLPRKYRVAARDDGLEFLHTFAKQQLNEHIPQQYTSSLQH